MAPTPDIEYLSLVIYKWLVQSDRLLDKKYLVGESYGGYRGPMITHYLQSKLGVAMNGVVLVSPYLNPEKGDGDLSPIPWMIDLPVDNGRASGVRRQADGRGDAAGDRVHARRLRRSATERSQRPGC